MSGTFFVLRKIAFCYGHRLLNYEGKCKFLHGHNALAEIEIEAETLDPRGMVADFSEIKSRMKGWIDEHLDHKMLLHKDDPLIPHLKQLGEPYVAMSENPTTENIAKLLFQKVLEMGFQVRSVRLWETQDSLAVYRE